MLQLRADSRACFLSQDVSCPAWPVSLIVNGGVAGFGLGGSPNYNTVLYDPSKPLNQRMSIMANTTVARLYHSEAITLFDSRVMISGSDPTGNYDSPGGEFPEEYRVEVYTPPYLLSGAARPSFTITYKDWTYSSTAQFTVSDGTGNLKSPSSAASSLPTETQWGNEPSFHK